MDYRSLGPSGLKVSSLCLARRVIDRANFIDTAIFGPTGAVSVTVLCRNNSLPGNTESLRAACNIRRQNDCTA
jgi:hypothetical protein